VIRLERGLCLVLLFLAEAEEPLNARLAVRAVLPFAGRSPRERRRPRRVFQRHARVEQRLHVDPVVDCCHSHDAVLSRRVTEPANHTSVRFDARYRGYDSCMSPSGPKADAGSAGIVETQFLELSRPISFDCGQTLHPVRIAYETYGVLSAARDNVILVCHALSGDAHAAGFAKTPPAESTRDGFGAGDRDGSKQRGLGWWDGMIGPGKAFDTNRFFVVSTNLLGGCRGTTGPSSIDPETGKPYGSDFPVITVADMVRAQRAFLDEIGVTRLAAVAGGSLGGMQAFEWAILYPDQVDAIVAIPSTHPLQPQALPWNAIARHPILPPPPSHTPTPHT